MMYNPQYHEQQNFLNQKLLISSNRLRAVNPTTVPSLSEKMHKANQLIIQNVN